VVFKFAFYFLKRYYRNDNPLANVSEVIGSPLANLSGCSSLTNYSEGFENFYETIANSKFVRGLLIPSVNLPEIINYLWSN
jgi:hypothetical protein